MSKWAETEWANNFTHLHNKVSSYATQNFINLLSNIFEYLNILKD